jgi:KDO2-lipid IV(A) lauroyltransferase
LNRADLLDWTLHLAMSGMPMDMCSATGARLAPLMGKKSHPDQHRKAMRFIASVRPDLAADPVACEAAVDRLWANVGRTFAEFAVSHRMLRAGRVGMDGADRLNDALSSGRPIVAIFPHLGNWELSEMQFGFHAPHRGAVIVAPPASDAKAQIAHRVRSKAPAELLPISKTVWRKALAKLKQPGGGVMIAIDEQAEGRVWAPFFDRPARVDGNLGKAARLALLTKALVVPFHNERLGGAHFVTRFLPIMELEGKANDDEAILEAVRRMNAVMTEPVLRLIDQWYMALTYSP